MVPVYAFVCGMAYHHLFIMPLLLSISVGMPQSDINKFEDPVEMPTWEEYEKNDKAAQEVRKSLKDVEDILNELNQATISPNILRDYGIERSWHPFKTAAVISSCILLISAMIRLCCYCRKRQNRPTRLVIIGVRGESDPPLLDTTMEDPVENTGSSVHAINPASHFATEKTFSDVNMAHDPPPKYFP